MNCESTDNFTDETIVRIERERAQARERVKRYKARKRQLNYKDITISIPKEYEAEIRSCVAAAVAFLQRQKKS
jgi:hypothetical protein